MHARDIGVMMDDGTLSIDSADWEFSDERERRTKPHKEIPLHGFWMEVAKAVHCGHYTEDALCAALNSKSVFVVRAVDTMVRRGYLHRCKMRLSLTHKSKVQVERDRVMGKANAA